MNQEQQDIDQLYKSHFGKMVNAMLRFSIDISIEIAEDLVQDAFLSALAVWPVKGVPDNPAGWIYIVCRNNAINLLNKSKTFTNPFEKTSSVEWPLEIQDRIVNDQTMHLLFACAHPKLSAKMQIVIMLKYVANLRTESIAKALGLTVDGIDKLLLRAKERIKLESVFLTELSAHQLRMRLPIVHKFIYLMFNEGYKANSGKEIISEALCEESLLLTKSLLDGEIKNSDTIALYALLLLNAARLGARFGNDGELLDMEEQNRMLWNSDLIALGKYYLEQSESEQICSYHLEAAIAYLHTNAKQFAETDWISIIRLYQHLLDRSPNPFIELNYGIALYYGGETTKAFDILHALQQTFLDKSFLLHASLGKLYMQEGNDDLSKDHLQKAHALTHFQAEQNLIGRMLEKVNRS